MVNESIIIQWGLHHTLSKIMLPYIISAAISQTLHLLESKLSFISCKTYHENVVQ